MSMGSVNVQTLWNRTQVQVHKIERGSIHQISGGPSPSLQTGQDVRTTKTGRGVRISKHRIRISIHST